MYIALDNKASKNKVGKISQYYNTDQWNLLFTNFGGGAETDKNSAETDKSG